MTNRYRSASRRMGKPPGGLSRGFASEEILCKAVGKPTIDEIRAQQRQERLAEMRSVFGSLHIPPRLRKEEHHMTVSLYKSTASGVNEIVVQTNAQSLDVFISGLSDALADAIMRTDLVPGSDPHDLARLVLTATLKNAFPVAFAIAGYKAEKVSETKLLTCGFAPPDASELVGQSNV